MLKRVGSHPNINRLLGSCQNKDGNYILLEMCNGGDLKQLSVASQGISEQQAAAYMLKLLETTQYMHSTGLLPSCYTASQSLWGEQLYILCYARQEC